MTSCDAYTKRLEPHYAALFDMYDMWTSLITGILNVSKQ